MKVLLLSITFFLSWSVCGLLFLHKQAVGLREHLHGGERGTGVLPSFLPRKASSAVRSPPLPMIRSVALKAGGRPQGGLIAHHRGVCDLPLAAWFDVPSDRLRLIRSARHCSCIINTNSVTCWNMQGLTWNSPVQGPRPPTKATL